jgi:hypothetical protein
MALRCTVGETLQVCQIAKFSEHRLIVAFVLFQSDVRLVLNSHAIPLLVPLPMYVTRGCDPSQLLPAPAGAVGDCSG